MREIKVLNKIVSDQIAAGEVVERPASVVKELVENSLDAGADRIHVELVAGGVGRIRIQDNGSGFPDGDEEKAFLRHATSKMLEIEDLDAIASFGFRGEALASISSVAKITLNTRTKEQVEGKRVRIDGGEIKENRAVGCPVGTEFDVRDLFFNVPARLKFLKRESTENSHCIEAVMRLALIRPDVSFKIVSNGRIVRELVKVESKVERVKELFSSETLAYSEAEESGIRVVAVLGAPDRAKAGAGSLYTYVNGRYIRDKSLLRAVSQAFGTILPNGRYPVGFISVEMSPAGFDVNVHPQKTEVRFTNQQAVFRAVSHAVGAMAAESPWHQRVYDSAVHPAATANTSSEVDKDTVRESSVGYTSESTTPVAGSVNDSGVVPSLKVPPARYSRAFGSGQVRPAAEALSHLRRPVGPASSSLGTGADANANANANANATTDAVTGTADAVANNMVSAVSHDSDSLVGGDLGRGYASMTYVGQVGGTYLVFDSPDGMVLIDQHAAHERVTYERLREQYLSSGVVSQRLLTPYQVDLGAAEADRIETYRENLLALGLDVTRVAIDRVAIHAIPAAVADVAPDNLMAEMVLALEERREGSRGESDDNLMAVISCHGSIRAGRKVSPGEVHSLVEQMDKIDFSGHCPHGRPVSTKILWSEIEKRVKRG